MSREDTVTNTVEDAARFEQHRAQSYDSVWAEDKPTKAETDADERDDRE